MAHDFKKFPELTNSQMQFYYFSSPHRQITEGFIADVIKVTDGDTIRVKWSERDFDFPVRMRDIDALELGEGGEQSASWLRSQILNKEVYVEVNPKLRVGKFGRLLGKIISGGQDMGEMSLNLGLAVPFGAER